MPNPPEGNVGYITVPANHKLTLLSTSYSGKKTRYVFRHRPFGSGSEFSKDKGVVGGTYSEKPPFADIREWQIYGTFYAGGSINPSFLYVSVEPKSDNVWICKYWFAPPNGDPNMDVLVSAIPV